MFNKKNKMTIKEYAYYNLYIISNGAENFFGQNKDFLKFNIYSEIAYYTFFTYISEIILLKKYPETTVDKIVEKILDRIKELQYENCTPKTEETKSSIENLYSSCYNKLKKEGFDFSKKEDLSNMAKLFLQILDIPTDIMYVMKISIEFSGFVKFHTQDILNPNIKLIEK